MNGNCEYTSPLSEQSGKTLPCQWEKSPGQGTPSAAVLGTWHLAQMRRPRGLPGPLKGKEENVPPTLWLNSHWWDLLGCLVVKTLPSNAEGTGSKLGWETTDPWLGTMTSVPCAARYSQNFLNSNKISNIKGFPCGSTGKEYTYNAAPGLGRSPGEWKGYPLQYSGLENSMHCIDHGVAKSWTRQSDFHFLSSNVKTLAELT